MTALTRTVPTWTVHTDVFDGPLDLLLYLVKRDGVDLRTVAIAPVADSYLAFLERLQILNISVASDYLVMAATLCHLKSLELLPRPPAILEDEGDPVEALAQQLEAYAEVKAAAEALDLLPRQDRDTFVREPMDVGDVDRPLVPGVDAFALLDLYFEVITRPEPAAPTHTIHRPEVDLGACVRHVLSSLGGIGGKADLSGILRTMASRSQRVIAFVAVLEMIRLQWLGVHQEDHLQPVILTSRVAADHDLSALRADVVAEAG